MAGLRHDGGMAPPPSTPPTRTKPSTVDRLWTAVRAAPLTATVAVVMTLIFAAQLAVPAVVDGMQRGPGIVDEGQWWRLFGALLVQPSGWGQFAYNTIGLVLVGVVVERSYGRARWLVIFLAAGLAGGVLMLVLRPDDAGGGSSDAVAGLIGALTVMSWRTRRLPSLPARLYAVHFALYLAVFAMAGVIAGTVAGALAVALVASAPRAGHTRLVRAGFIAIVVSAAVVMAAIGDGHGIGLVTGLVIGALLVPRQAPTPPENPRLDHR